MKKKHRILGVEALENRVTPALTVRVLPGNLILSGTPSGATGLTFTGVGGNKIQISDGGANLGTYSVTGNLQLSLTRFNEPITIDPNGQTIPGNVVLGLGNGNPSTAALSANAITILDGTVGGSISVTGGIGTDTLELGDGAGVDNLVVRGNVVFSAPSNLTAGNGNDFLVRGGSSIRGSISLANVPQVQLGESLGTGITVGGGVTVANATAKTEASVEFLGTTTVGGAVAITGTNRFVSQGDVVLVESTATVTGNFSANLGDNINLWRLGGTFLGNVSVYGGSGSAPLATFPVNEIDIFDPNTSLAGVINGSLIAQTGSGSTSFALPDGGIVLGNVTLNFGSGGNDLGGGALTLALTTPGIIGAINGNLSITLGNGSNFTQIQTAPGGKITYRGGNGGDTVELFPTATSGNIWLLDLTFGNGTNTLTLTNPTVSAPHILMGRVTGGTGSNTLAQGTDWTLSPTLILTNF